MTRQIGKFLQMKSRSLATVGIILVLGTVTRAQDEAILPQGVRAVWDLSKAYRETTPTRERICINGLWKWQPADSNDVQVPGGNWGYFKVPGCWPGITDYMQKDCQTVYAHPSWKGRRMGSLSAAWYQREIAIPDSWAGRRIALSAECLNSLATVFVDGKAAGEIRFPGGELDLDYGLPARAASTCSACWSWPRRSRRSCCPISIRPRPGRSRARCRAAVCAATFF